MADGIDRALQSAVGFLKEDVDQRNFAISGGGENAAHQDRGTSAPTSARTGSSFARSLRADDGK